VFFLIRSIFWLSVVFYSMTWAVGATPPQSHALRDAVVQEGIALVSVAKDAAVGQARAWCTRSPEQCLSDAAQLTALVIANQTDDTTIDATNSIDTVQALPVPRRDPRHHASPKG
jgi:hypothetical protein